MPEGHVAHRLARDHAGLVGLPVAASSPQGRFAAGAAAVDGRILDDVAAAGKHLFHRFGEHHLHVHLGKQGKFLRVDPAVPARPQVRLRLVAGSHAWDLIAPMRCELLDGDARKALEAGLGPDPLDPGADGDEAVRRLAAHAGAIGVALLDQSAVAGVGNVLRAEALWACRVHPARAAAEVPPAELRCLWSTLVAMMRRAVDDGRIITVDLPDDVRREVAEADGRNIYKQAACRRCRTPVDTWPLGGQTAYACPRCQRPGGVTG